MFNFKVTLYLEDFKNCLSVVNEKVYIFLVVLTKSFDIYLFTLIWSHMIEIFIHFSNFFCIQDCAHPDSISYWV